MDAAEYESMTMSHISTHRVAQKCTFIHTHTHKYTPTLLHIHNTHTHCAVDWALVTRAHVTALLQHLRDAPKAGTHTDTQVGIAQHADASSIGRGKFS